jgi:hypothetical protein
MQLQLSSWPEVEKYLQTSRAILIPIGSIQVRRLTTDLTPGMFWAQTLRASR